MKVAFSGAHGSGKTTCALWLSDHLKIPYITGIAKKLVQTDDLIDTIPKIISFQDEVLNYKINVEKDTESFVTDRSFVDLYVYLKAHLAQIPAWEMFEMTSDEHLVPGSCYKVNEKTLPQYVKEYQNKCIEHNNAYDIIFVTDPVVPADKSENITDMKSKNSFYNEIIKDNIKKDYTRYSHIINGSNREKSHENISETSGTSIVFLQESSMEDRKKRILSYF